MLTVLQIAFCVKGVKSVTEQHTDKMNQRPPRQPGHDPATVYLSQSQNYTSPKSALTIKARLREYEREAWEQEAREGCNHRGLQEHLSRTDARLLVRRALSVAGQTTTVKA